MALDHNVLKGLDGRVVVLNSGKDALMLHYSPAIGLVAVKADFQRGLKNSEYSLFSSYHGHVVDDKGHEIQSSSPMVIASAVSNKAIKDTEVKHDLFSEVEMSYVGYLKSSLATLRMSLAATKLNSAKEVKRMQQISERRDVLHNKIVADMKKNQAVDLLASNASLASLKSAVATEEAQRIFESNKSVVDQAAEDKKRKIASNVNRLAQMMNF